MNNITNKKLKGINEWADFIGFSLLFDNPGDSLRIMDCGLLKVNCILHDHKLKLYKILNDLLNQTIPNMPPNDYLFCPLPFSSYHMTVLDLINYDNLNRLNERYIPIFKNYLNGFCNSFHNDHEFHSIIYESILFTDVNWDINFKFNKLTKWSNKVLVARLIPTDRNSKDQLKILEIERKKIIDKFKSKYGNFFSTHISDFKPHISLGYFANKEYGALITEEIIESWSQEFKNHLQDNTINFQSIRLYGFTNMATYFRKSG